MSSLRVHHAFLVAVVVVVVAMVAGLASAHGDASAQVPAAETTTTELQPGWNLVGWMGSATTTVDLFDSIPALQVVAAWDEGVSRYAWTRRGGRVPAALASIPRGRALFLWLSGNRPVQWARPASVEGVLLTLPPGHSLVGWAGLDETPIAEAVGRFGDALVGASWWNTATQSYERYEPGVEESAEGTSVLNHGDALWVELSEERRWWQSGTARTRFEIVGFAGGVIPVWESELREEMEQAVAFFAERYGIEPPEFVVRVAPLSRDTHALPGLIYLGRDFRDVGPIASLLAHEYFHVLQHDLSRQQSSATGSPTWLTEGTATYGALVYTGGFQGERDDVVRAGWWSLVSHVVEPLSGLEARQPFYALGLPGYQLGTLAVDWLIRRAAGLIDNELVAPSEPGGLDEQQAYAAHIEYYRLLRSSATWQAAFKKAFGIGVDDFYAAFEVYRSGIVPALPHLVDYRLEPILDLVGEIPPETAADVRAEFDTLQAQIGDRFGKWSADYTIFVLGDAEPVADVYSRVLGREPDGPTCSGQGSDAAFVTLTCRDELPARVAWLHFDDVRLGLAPERYSLTPQWLVRGARSYLEQVANAVAEPTTIKQARGRQITLARGEAPALRSLEAPIGPDTVESNVHDALSFLAVEWLVQRATEHDIFEYYWRLPRSDSWQEAFEDAFGIAVDDFYDAFAEYRAAGFTS